MKGETGSPKPVKEPVKALLEKSAENIFAAEELLKKEFPDIAVSRSYFAMFYAAQAVLLAEGITFSSPEGVRAAFGEDIIKNRRRIPLKFHRYLLDAFRERQSADYDAPSNVKPAEAKAMVRRAEEFLEAVEKILDKKKRV